MADVETNSSDSVKLNAKMNGVNGVCDDEPMDVDSQDDSRDDSQASSEVSTKKSESSDIVLKKCVTSPSPEDIVPSNNSKSDDNPNNDHCDESNQSEESKSSRPAQSSPTPSSDSPHENGNSDDGTNDVADEDATSADTDAPKAPTEIIFETTDAKTDDKPDESSENSDESRDSENSKSNSNSVSEKDPIAVDPIPIVPAAIADADVEMADETETVSKSKVPSEKTEDEIGEEPGKEKEVEKSTKSAGDDGPDVTNGDDSLDDDVQHVPIVQEVHAISDSDDDDEVHNKTKAPESKPATSIQQNGHNIDDDKPVSIHSDSESETGNEKNSSEVHEILSDKEDCVLVEDDKDERKGETEFVSPRRSTRARKSVVKVRDFSAFDDDIEEVVEDPLMQPAAKKQKTSPGPPPLGITIQDARSLAADPLMTPVNSFQQQFMSATSAKKEPTLVIIDTNQIIQRGASQGLSVQSVNSGGSIRTSPSSKGQTSITKSSIGLNHQSSAPLLPALTDDMFVLEAPSFIVPYIYEKPPQENLKDIVEKIGKELEEQNKKDEAERKKDDKEEKLDDAKSTGSTSPGPDSSKETTEAKTKDDKKKKKKKRTKDGDDSWDESDTSTDDEASDSEQRTKVLIKEVKDDLDVIKPHIISAETLKDSSSGSTQGGKKDNYFDSPLGLFFMDIGINLVQEHVQTDLLRQQKKKLSRDGDAAASSIQIAINSLMKNLNLSKTKNDGFKFETKRCEYCNYKSESVLAMAHHYETPHLNNQQYKCNFCSFESRPPYDILFHMEAVHNIKARLEKSQSYHQCPNCPFEDNGKSKLARHAIICQKKFRPEVNLNPPVDWEPPAKIPRIKPRHGLVGTATAYQVKLI